MSEVGAGGNKVTSYEFCSDKHTVSLLTIDDEKEKALKNGYITSYTIFLHAHGLCILNRGDVIQSDAIMPVGYGGFLKKAGRR